VDPLKSLLDARLVSFTHSFAPSSCPKKLMPAIPLISVLRIVIVSNYTQTLDLIGRMCRESHWGFCRLDGSIGMKKRQKMVDEFNDPSSSLIAFLLSSKAGGW